MEEKKDNDAIYKKLKQVAKDDRMAELNPNGQEAQLLGRLAVLPRKGSWKQSSRS